MKEVTRTQYFAFITYMTLLHGEENVTDDVDVFLSNKDYPIVRVRFNGEVIAFIHFEPNGGNNCITFLKTVYFIDEFYWQEVRFHTRYA
jgi:hypothetical protein